MSRYNSGRILASVSTKPSPLTRQKKKDDQEAVQRTVRENEIQVSATGDVRLQPDRCRVNIHVSSSKDTVQEAKNSVTRRTEYIMQTLNNYHVKESDISVTKILRKDDGLCYCDTTVTVVFVDVNKCQNVCNFLAEKLDETVKISFPEFFHNAQKLETVRKQACLKAVQNSRQKAQDVAKLLGQTLGQVIMIREEATEEWEGRRDGTRDTEDPMTLQAKIELATFNVSVRVFACFEIKSKAKVKKVEHGDENIP